MPTFSHKLANSLMNEILVEEGWPDHNISVLSGPNFAREIVKDLPALILLDLYVLMQVMQEAVSATAAVQMPRVT